jgi:hypothetical protein
LCIIIPGSQPCGILLPPGESLLRGSGPPSWRQVPGQWSPVPSTWSLVPVPGPRSPVPSNHSSRAGNPISIKLPPQKCVPLFRGQAVKHDKPVSKTPLFYRRRSYRLVIVLLYSLETAGAGINDKGRTLLTGLSPYCSIVCCRTGTCSIVCHRTGAGRKGVFCLLACHCTSP